MIKRRNNNKTRTALAPPLEGETGRGLSGTVEAELAGFKKSWTYLLSILIVIFSSIVAIGILVDFFYDNREQRIDIQNMVKKSEFFPVLDDLPIEYAAQLRTEDLTLTIDNEIFIKLLHKSQNFAKSPFRIDESFMPLLQKSQYITIHSTRWLGQPKYLTANNINERIYHASIYNDAIVLWAFLLLFGLRIFFTFRSKLAELLITRYYTLFILPFINIFVLLGR